MSAYPAAERHRDAERAWAEADALLAAGDLPGAFIALTRAHDLTTDQPAAHRRAHERLLPVDQALGRRRDAFVDRLLLALAPVGVFTALAWYFRLLTDYDAMREAR